MNFETSKLHKPEGVVARVALFSGLSPELVVHEQEFKRERDRPKFQYLGGAVILEKRLSSISPDSNVAYITFEGDSARMRINRPSCIDPGDVAYERIKVEGVECPLAELMEGLLDAQKLVVVPLETEVQLHDF